MKDRVPHVKRVDGVDHWFIEGDQDFGPLGYSTVDKDRVKHLGADFLSTFDSIDRAAYDPRRSSNSWTALDSGPRCCIQTQGA